MRWIAAALPALAIAACGREVKRGTALPVDTAARATLPTFDTTAVPPDSAFAPMAPPSAGGAAAAEPAPPSLVTIADSAAGDSIFHGKGRCFTCHGQRGEGTARLGPALTDSTGLASRGSLAAIGAVIANGVAAPRTTSVAMPAYAGALSPQEIARAAAYVYALAHPGHVVSDTTPPATHGDSAAHASQVPSGDSLHMQRP